MKRTLSTLGLAALVTTWVVPAGAQVPISDHLKCFKVRDPAPKAAYTVDLSGLGGPNTGCVVKVPGKLLCVETAKVVTGEPVPPGGVTGNPAGRVLCYKVKCPKIAGITIPWTDQFGARPITQLGPPKLLCAPEQALVTTTTSTTSTTGPSCPTSTTNPPCLAGMCQACGSCGNGECHQSGGGFGCGAPTTTPVCIDKTACASMPMSCSTDADCPDPSRPACVFGGVTGGSACCALCP